MQRNSRQVRILPLRAARKSMGLTLGQVAEVALKAGYQIDESSLSRIERAEQTANSRLASVLAELFKPTGLTELHVIYPDRFPFEPVIATPRAASGTGRRRRSV